MYQGAFLMRGLANVRAEFSLTALAYNLRRALNILGLNFCAKRMAAFRHRHDEQQCLGWREAAEDWSRGGSDLNQIKCLRRGADNAAANCGLN